MENLKRIIEKTRKQLEPNKAKGTTKSNKKSKTNTNGNIPKFIALVKKLEKKPNNKYLCEIQNGKPDQFNSQQHHGHEIFSIPE